MVGSVLLGAAMTTMSFLVFVAGLLVFGAGMNGAQQLRVAATDMVPPSMRGSALGYLSLGTLLGLGVSPVVATFAEDIARDLGTNTLSLPWYLLPVLIVPGMWIVSLVRPDPKYIGMNLQEFYPGYVPRSRPAEDGQPAKKFGAMQVMRNTPVLLAITSNAAAIGNMSVVMVLTSLVLSHHGFSLTEIAISHMFHSAGMFAFTVPLGKLADRAGRTRVMYPGVAVALMGSSLVAHTDGSYWLVTLGTFLVGLGWAAANVAATALIADHYETQERGRALGVNESWSGATSMVMALLTGPLIYWSGLPATGLAAMLLAGVPFALWIALKMTRGSTR
jgi:MFS family permease